MRLTLIVAMAANRVIGRDGELPWRLPADLKRFKMLTMGHYLLMGRTTFESIGRPLPGRTTVVITRQRDYAVAGVLVAHSVESAVRLARSEGEDEVFVAGGAEIYRQTLERADRLQLTLLHRSFAGDVFFPEYDVANWKLVSREDVNDDAKSPCAYSFLVYERNWVRTGSPPE